MSTPSSSPLKRLVRRFRRGNTDGAGDGAPAAAAKGTAAAIAPVAPTTPPPKCTKKRKGDAGDDGLAPAAKRAAPTPDPNAKEEPEAQSPLLPKTPRSFRTVAAAMAAATNPDRIRIFEDAPTDEEIKEYQRRGVEYQHWMANTNPTGPAPPVALSTLTIDALIQPVPPNTRPLFNVKKSGFEPAPEEIRESLKSTNLPRDSETWRFSHLTHLNSNSSCYKHYIIKGAIVASEIFRRGYGPRWSEIALSLYKQNATVDTLQHLFFTNVVNDETQPLLGKVIYPSRDWNIDGRLLTPIIRTWDMNTPAFEQILGTQLGRIAGLLVLGAWPVGTHQITKIHTWYLRTDLHMRFDIEPIVAAPHLPASAGPSAGAAAPPAAPTF
ncbi:hypothetical protein N7491_010719 [Penicillium cf. griseofulvum]|uniref:Uncharacterized protein n=1 Tax=Penicillium cf. griseofulvum TaxID=2972120 RepID=A0A9W9T642_9EURO|nr:hypothetical protein N7472_001043 [Penicillium cf. griseofulvum]KAJ5422274.1 hypothetical protein N7491_010719 [Penicillium cf. griseofulvum]